MKKVLIFLLGLVLLFVSCDANSLANLGNKMGQFGNNVFIDTSENGYEISVEGQVSQLAEMDGKDRSIAIEESEFQQVVDVFYTATNTQVNKEKLFVAMQEDAAKTEEENDILKEAIANDLEKCKTVFTDTLGLDVKGMVASKEKVTKSDVIVTQAMLVVVDKLNELESSDENKEEKAQELINTTLDALTILNVATNTNIVDKINLERLVGLLSGEQSKGMAQVESEDAVLGLELLKQLLLEAREYVDSESAYNGYVNSMSIKKALYEVIVFAVYDRADDVLTVKLPTQEINLSDAIEYLFATAIVKSNEIVNTFYSTEVCSECNGVGIFEEHYYECENCLAIKNEYSKECDECGSKNSLISRDIDKNCSYCNGTGTIEQSGIRELIIETVNMNEDLLQKEIKVGDIINYPEIKADTEALKKIVDSWKDEKNSLIVLLRLCETQTLAEDVFDLINKETWE